MPGRSCGASGRDGACQVHHPGLAAARRNPRIWFAYLLQFVSVADRIVIVAHGRSLFPDRLLGRGMTTLNLAQVVGASVMPVLTGAVAPAIA